MLTSRLRNCATFALATSVVGLQQTKQTKSAHCEGEDKPKMYFRVLGNTGLQVSVLSFGFWATFGSKDDLKNDEGLETAKACLRVARDGGINTFDNAEVYGRGEAERVMGLAFEQLAKEDPVKWRRSDLVVTTKIFLGGDGVNEKGLSRKHIVEGADASLKRLKMDYVDLIFCHRPDPITPTETVVAAMTELIRSGKATAWGTSEWSAQQITEAFWIAKMNGLEPPQFEQPQYNMFHRDRVETEYHPIYAAPYKYGTTTWSPLASGLLTGKYNTSIPEGSRAAAPQYTWLQKTLETWRAEGKINKVIELEKYAREHFDCSVGQLAIAWCVRNENVSTVLLGATKPDQVAENLGAVVVAERLTQEHMSAIDAILNNKPVPYGGYGGSPQWRYVITLPKL